jgi:hypothetical protein
MDRHLVRLKVSKNDISLGRSTISFHGQRNQ